MRTNTSARLAAALAAVAAGSIPLAEAQQGGVKSYTFTDTRDMRYCEILVVAEGGIQVYKQRA